jgi:threonine/homoserine/homoserine lactone efflux protein
MSAFFQGIIVGLTFAVLLGPGFFAMVQTCILRGFTAGVCLSIGVFLSDVFVLVLCFFGITQLLGVDPRNNVWFQIIGGMVLTILGVYTFNKRVVQAYPYQNGELIGIGNRNHLYVIKGFFLNVFNPGIWFIWITVTVSITARYGANDRSTGIFLAGILSTTLTADLLKCFVSHHISRFCGTQTMARINHVIGLILIVFGVVLMLFRNKI